LGGMEAPSWVAERKVVATATPFHINRLPFTKLVPVAVRASGVTIPAGEVLGSIETRVGTGPRGAGVTARRSVLLVVLSGLVTPTVMVPAVATAEAAILAWSWVAESNDVARATSFSVIAAPETNPIPVAVNVKDPLPAVTAGGEMEVSLREFPVMVRVSVLEVVLSGFITRMLTFPGAAICAAVTFPVSSVVDETAVESEMPFQRIVVPLTKFVPVAVRTKSVLPAATEAGERETSVGGRTPLNPPHPHRNRDKTAKSRGRRIRDQLIE
jgi:hypothetical protein